MHDSWLHAVLRSLCTSVNAALARSVGLHKFDLDRHHAHRLALISHEWSDCSQKCHIQIVLTPTECMFDLNGWDNTGVGLPLNHSRLDVTSEVTCMHPRLIFETV
jgi:hypothetical protein